MQLDCHSCDNNKQNQLLHEKKKKTPFFAALFGMHATLFACKLLVCRVFLRHNFWFSIVCILSRAGWWQSIFMIVTNPVLGLWHSIGEMLNGSFWAISQEGLNEFTPLFLICKLHICLRILHINKHPLLIWFSVKTLALGVPVQPSFIVISKFTNHCDVCKRAKCYWILALMLTLLLISSNWVTNVRLGLCIKNTVRGGWVPVVSSTDSAYKACCYGDHQCISRYNKTCTI